MSKLQRQIMQFLEESYVGAWSRGSLRRNLYGSRSTPAQRAAFCRSLNRLKNRGLITVGGPADRDRIAIVNRFLGSAK